MRDTRASDRRCRALASGGRAQGQQQVHGLVISRPERHRRFQAHEDGAHAIQALDAGMGNGHALADAGRTGRLALHQAFQHHVGVDAQNPGGDVGDDAEHLTLARRADA